MNSHSILRVVAKFMIPFIFLYALYVQFHGDFGPGGGFQAGVIFAVGFILFALIYGIDEARRVLPASVTRMLLALGVLLYAGVGILGMVLGGNFLNYSVLAKKAVSGQHLGILLIEFGVGVTVAATIITVFFIFAGQDR